MTTLQIGPAIKNSAPSNGAAATIGVAGASSPPATRDDTFERHRRRLTGLAYRMLGSVAEAEDAVQETYLLWHRVDKSAITNPRAFLAKTVWPPTLAKIAALHHRVTCLVSTVGPVRVCGSQ